MFVAFLGAFCILYIFNMTKSSSVFSKLYKTATPRPVFSLTVSGGGTGAVNQALSEPGASGVVMEATVPYSKSAFKTYLGEEMVNELDRYCSADTAKLLARRSRQVAATHFLRDHGFAEASEANIFGVACTASLVTSSQKKGDHRAHIAVATAEGISQYSVTLQKNERTRREEDEIVSKVIVEAIAQAAGVEGPVALGEWRVHTEAGGGADTPHSIVGDELGPGDAVRVTPAACAPHNNLTATLQNILDGRVRKALFLPRANCDASRCITEGSDGSGFMCVEDCELPDGTLVYPGSYNPLHDGHVSLATAARTAVVQSDNAIDPSPAIVFEISAFNADKPPLSLQEMERRLEQFLPTSPQIQRAGLPYGSYGVVFSNEPLFSAKSHLFSGCSFVVGVDTFSRIINPKYYSNSPYEMVAALCYMHAQGTHMYIGGRKNSDDGSFQTLAEAMSAVSDILPADVRAMFTGLSEEEFRSDISSTDIRARVAAEGEPTK